MLGSRVYVGGLLCGVREPDLERFFEGYGRTQEILIKNGYSYVEFEDYRDADDAVYELNGKELLGERVVVEIARGFGRDRYDPYDNDRHRGKYNNSRSNSSYRPLRTKYRVIVENLSSRVSWLDLMDYMRQAGEVTYAAAHKQRRNEGVVEFASLLDMKTAIEELDDTYLNDRRICLVEVHRGGRGVSDSSSSRSRSRSLSTSKSKSRSRSRSRSPRCDYRSPYRSSSERELRSRSRSNSSRDSRSRDRSDSVDTVKCATADGVLTDNPHLVLLFYMAQLFLRELVKSYRLIQVVPMDMSGYYENRAGPSNLGNVISQILLCKQITPDFNQEELCSITKDSQDIAVMLSEMQEFMPQHETYLERHTALDNNAPWANKGRHNYICKNMSLLCCVSRPNYL